MVQSRWVRSAPSGSNAGKVMPSLPSIEAVYLTDPEALAAVLPPPLSPPPSPRVHVRFTEIRLDFGEYKFRENLAFFAVDALYRGQLGEYPLLIPIDHEGSVSISRERFGEPKKLARVDISREGNRVEARVVRHNVAFIELSGEVIETLPTPAPYAATQWWFKFMPSVTGSGFDGAPLFVRVDQKRSPLKLERMKGSLELRELATDPVVDLPLRELVSMHWTVRTSTLEPKVVGPVEDVATFERYAYARYDHA